MQPKTKEQPPYFNANKIILSPMHGVTDLPFRKLCHELSEGKFYAVSEFLSTDGSTFLTRDNIRAMRFEENERPFCMQLFGISPEKLAHCAAQAQKYGADFIELNAGCPVPKVAGKGGGAGLLKNLPLLAEILNKMKAAISVPLYLKCRLGWDEHSICAKEVLNIAENEGVEMLTIHGRTRVQGYKGLADWEKIGEVAAIAKIPVIGNGDINSAEKAIEILSLYKVSGLSIGRAALHNPWIFLQISNAMQGKPSPQISAEQVCNAMHIYAKFLEQDGCSQLKSLGRLKQFGARLSKGFEPAIPEFRLQMLRTENYNTFLEQWKTLTNSCKHLNFKPENLQNLNGQNKDYIEYGNQF